MKIMACADGSKPSEKAIKIAAQLAEVSGSELLLLHVIENDVSREKPVFDEYGEQYKKAKEIIQNAQKIASEVAPHAQIKTRIAVGPVSAEIVRIAEEERFGSIFIGTTGTSRLLRLLLGSVADDVIHYAHCPVTVVR
jgi:nucleotide-binding universal stress UspA family protein